MWTGAYPAELDFRPQLLRRTHGPGNENVPRCPCQRKRNRMWRHRSSWSGLLTQARKAWKEALSVGEIISRISSRLLWEERMFTLKLTVFHSFSHQVIISFSLGSLCVCSRKGSRKLVVFVKRDWDDTRSGVSRLRLAPILLVPGCESASRRQPEGLTKVTEN